MSQEIKEKLWLNDEEIAEIESLMGRPGFASTWSYATISNLLKDRIALNSSLELAIKELELIANGNINFPSWEDTVDILIDVRKVAKETVLEIRGIET